MASNKPTGKLNDEDAFSKWLNTPAPKKPKSREEVKKKQAENISKALKRKQATEKGAKVKKEKLTAREQRFCQLYVETNNGSQSVVNAGYNVSNLRSAGVYAAHLLARDKIKEEISRLMKVTEKASIATAQEVMERFTAIARGEDKDQFGLEISASDRLKALVELAKRTVDVEQRMAGKADAVVEIKLDWKRD